MLGTEEKLQSAGDRGSLGLGGMCVLQDLGNNKGLTSSRLVAMRPGSALEALNDQRSKLNDHPNLSQE